MGLSEFISRNNQERPDPKTEWAQSRLLIKTIEESGAVPLLELLRDSILSNPTLTGNKEGVFNRRATLISSLYAYNLTSINELIKSQGSQFEKSLELKVPSKYDRRAPLLIVEFAYNPELKMDVSGSPFNPSYSSYTAFDRLMVQCSVPNKLFLKLVSGAFNNDEINMEESQWRQRGAVGNALGQLYVKSPARNY